MDRRQRKTREAIFRAFTELLSEKKVSRITVGDIIERADIGRATFYAHFETKDYLQKALCEELFCHVFDSAAHEENGHRHIFECDAPDSVYLHLFRHLKKNDNNILDLLSCENNEIFLSFFKSGLINLISSRNEAFDGTGFENVPEDFRVNHVAATFVETVRWWVENKMKQSPEEITKYFLIAANIKGAAD